VKSPSKPHTSFRRTPRSNNHAKQQAEPNPVVILATCEGIINEIREKKKKKLAFFYNWFFLPPTALYRLKEASRVKHFQSKPMIKKIWIKPNPSGINDQTEMESGPSSFSSFTQHSLFLSLSLCSVWCPALDIEVGYMIISSCGGEGQAKANKPQLLSHQNLHK